ncbi:MAG: hypothetical protein IJH34_09920 [Romboutsia sp.]|nr:hypothetical protein [Romboutsia sp.]
MGRVHPLLSKYKELVDDKINSYGKDSELYKFWHKGKSKYSRGYYLSNEEAFARMGELYVTDILKLNSSFSKIDYSSPLQQAVYPNDKELLNLIDSYYSKIFTLLEDKFERVTFA